MAGSKYVDSHSTQMVVNVGDKRRLGRKQQARAPLIPRTTKGRCGTCAGLIFHDAGLGADVCRNCNRMAGPPAFDICSYGFT